MRILITGPTSFTGAFFIEALAQAGHEVHATSTQSLSSYTGVRRLRAIKSQTHADIHQGVKFGDEQFLRLVKRERFDVYCHHGAWTKDYRGMKYDFETAFVSNTRSIDKVCRLLSENGCRKIIVSSSIFERAKPLFSPYGLIKKLTTETVEFYGTRFGLHVSKFVIPNPFGPLDNAKLIDYLGREWQANRTPCIQTPLYVRDNIPVDLLALGFADWADKCPDTVGTSECRPSGYVSNMEEFVERVAVAFRTRLNLDCAVDMAEQQDFSQPITLVNDMPLQDMFLDWNEKEFWDALIAHQLQMYDYRQGVSLEG